MKARVAGIFVLGGLLLFASAVPGQDATELKPFVGKWRAYVSVAGTSTPVEMTVQRDGSYSTITYTQPPRRTQGRLELVDGKFRFKSSDGSVGAISLTVDSTGKKFLKLVRDDHKWSAEYAAVNVK